MSSQWHTSYVVSVRWQLNIWKKKDERERERNLYRINCVLIYSSPPSSSFSAAINQTIVYTHTFACTYCVRNEFKIKRKKMRINYLGCMCVVVKYIDGMSILYQFIRSLKTLQQHEMPIIMWSFNSNKWCMDGLVERERWRKKNIFHFIMCFSLFLDCLFDVTSFIFIYLRLMYWYGVCEITTTALIYAYYFITH